MEDESHRKIGGPGHIIEIDENESKFGKRKYNRGRRVASTWGILEDYRQVFSSGIS